MATKYLLRCDCGAELAVEPYQAGEEIRCHCGTLLPVPALRKLRELPLATELSNDDQPGWSFRHGVLTCSLLFAASLLAVGGYLWATEPLPLPAFNAETRDLTLSKNFEQFSPAQTFALWNMQYASLAENGFAPMQDPRRAFVQAKIDQRRMIEAILAAAGVVVAVLGVIAFAIMPNRSGDRPATT